jgi:hypothetical protein
MLFVSWPYGFIEDLVKSRSSGDMFVERGSLFWCELVWRLFPHPPVLPECFLDGAKVHGVLEMAYWRKLQHWASSPFCLTHVIPVSVRGEGQVV